MEKVIASDYKGKWFVLQDADIEDDFSFEARHVNVDWAMGEGLAEHVENCRYYGIPAYIGKDAAFNSRIKEIEKVLDKQEQATQPNDGSRPIT